MDGGLDWKPLSLTPKDMDFISAKHAAAGYEPLDGGDRLMRGQVIPTATLIAYTSVMMREMAERPD